MTIRKSLALVPWLVALSAASPDAQSVPVRERVDVSARPWNAIGQINNGAYGRCTGVLVGRQLAVTAAHCLFNRRTRRLMRPQSIHFVLGYDRGSFDYQSTASSFRMAATYDPFRRERLPADDWALLELAEPAPASIEPLTLATSPPENGDTFASAGFGRDRAYALTAVESCRFVSTTDRSLIVTECPITFGYSGGPLIDAEGRLAGIQVANGELNGRNVALAVPASAWVGDWQSRK